MNLKAVSYHEMPDYCGTTGGVAHVATVSRSCMHQNALVPPDNNSAAQHGAVNAGPSGATCAPMMDSDNGQVSVATSTHDAHLVGIVPKYSVQLPDDLDDVDDVSAFDSDRPADRRHLLPRFKDSWKPEKKGRRSSSTVRSIGALTSLSCALIRSALILLAIMVASFSVCYAFYRFFSFPGNKHFVFAKSDLPPQALIPDFLRTCEQFDSGTPSNESSWTQDPSELLQLREMQLVLTPSTAGRSTVKLDVMVAGDLNGEVGRAANSSSSEVDHSRLAGSSGQGLMAKIQLLMYNAPFLTLNSDLCTEPSVNLTCPIGTRDTITPLRIERGYQLPTGPALLKLIKARIEVTNWDNSKVICLAFDLGDVLKSQSRA